jgi:hypothetical protein
VFIGGSSAIAVSKFSSFRTILLLHDTLDATRQMLGRHQIYRRLAPWIQENPLQLHLTNDTTAAFDIALEQMHEVRMHAPLRACWIWTPLSDEISSFLPRHARDKHNENVTQLWRLCFLFCLSA